MERTSRSGESLLTCSGFWKTYAYMEKPDWEFLEKISYPTSEGPYSAYDFLHGGCDLFSSMLHKIFGYKVLYTYCGDRTLCHSYCVTDDGVYVDVRGKQSDLEVFFEDFEDWIDKRSVMETTFEETDAAVTRVWNMYLEMFPDRVDAAEQIIKKYYVFYSRNERRRYE